MFHCILSFRLGLYVRTLDNLGCLNITYVVSGFEQASCKFSHLACIKLLQPHNIIARKFLNIWRQHLLGFSGFQGIFEMQRQS